MAKAYILIETAVGRMEEVSEKLKGIEGVKEVDPVTGPYDLIAVVEAPDLDSLGNLIAKKIHPVEGILKTITCLSIKF